MNKRDKQRQIKEQKQEAARRRQQTQQTLTKVGLYVGIPLLLLVTVVTLLLQGPTYSPVEIAENDHVRGNPDTPVTVVVYADFQCPACATEHETMTRLWPSISDKAHLVFRHYPLTTSHRHAWTASLYAEAAARQGMFWPMHDYLFANQAVWASLSSVEDQFDSYALELNLDIDQLHADMELDEVIMKVRNDQRGGNSAGVLATPSVFVNGRQLPNPNRSSIREAVEEEFAEATASQDQA